MQVSEAIVSGPAGPSDTRNARFYLHSRERLRDRLDYFWDQAFIPKQEDWRSMPLPVALYPLYYLLRPLRLLYKFLIVPLVSRKAIQPIRK